MPRYEVDRFTYYRQHSRVVVEADDAEQAFALAKKEEPPEWKWEDVQRAPHLDGVHCATEINDADPL